MSNDVCFVSLPVYGFFIPERYSKTGGGGAKRQVYLLSKHMSDEIDVGVVVGDYGQEEIEEVDGVTLYRAYEPQKENKALSLYKLWSAMRQADADLYIYRGTPSKAAIVYSLAKLSGRDFAYHIAHNEDTGYQLSKNNLIIRQLFKKALKDSREVIAQTKHQKNNLLERHKIYSTVIPNGYSTIENQGSSDQDYFLWIGRMNKTYKRPHILLSCVDQLPEIKFCVVGTHTNTKYSEKVVEELKSRENVQFIESVPPNEILAYYENAIALINTSKSEGFPNTFLEAWRCGTPVVSLDVDPERYLNQDVFTGYCEGDINKMRELLKDLSTNPEYVSDVGKDLKSHFEKNYSIETVSQRYIQALGLSQEGT